MPRFVFDEINKRENYIKLRVSEKIYPKETIFAAGYVFLDKAFIVVDKDKQDVLVYLFPKKEGQDLRRLGFEFTAELLNYAHYFNSARINAEAVKAIMQRALFLVPPPVAKVNKDKELEELIKELEKEERVNKG